MKGAGRLLSPTGAAPSHVLSASQDLSSELFREAHRDIFWLRPAGALGRGDGNAMSRRRVHG